MVKLQKNKENLKAVREKTYYFKWAIRQSTEFSTEMVEDKKE